MATVPHLFAKILPVIMILSSYYEILVLKFYIFLIALEIVEMAVFDFGQFGLLKDYLFLLKLRG